MASDIHRVVDALDNLRIVSDPIQPRGRGWPQTSSRLWTSSGSWRGWPQTTSGPWMTPDLPNIVDVPSLDNTTSPWVDGPITSSRSWMPQRVLRSSAGPRHLKVVDALEIPKV